MENIENAYLSYTSYVREKRITIGLEIKLTERKSAVLIRVGGSRLVLYLKNATRYRTHARTWSPHSQEKSVKTESPSR